MKDIARYGAILALICVMASGLLAVVHSLTKARIMAQAQAEEKATLLEVLPGGLNFEPVKSDDDIIYYQAYGKENEFLGLAFKTSAKGYSSMIETMAGMAPDGTITAIKIVSQNETPGLGNKIIEVVFQERFRNKKTEDLKNVQAITGATVSSKAVIDSVEKKAKEIVSIRLMKAEE